MESELKSLNSHDSDPSITTLPLLKHEDSPASQDHQLINLKDIEKKCAAYVRHDVYGTLGREHVPFGEKVMLGLAMITILPFRVVLSMVILVFYYVVCRVCTLFSRPNGKDCEQQDFAHMGGWRQAVVVRSGCFLARVLLFLFGFYWIRETFNEVRSGGEEKDEKSDEAEHNDQSSEPERPGVIVSNHVSYVDILYHMSASYPSFVAKRSVGKLPLLGLISKCLGCIYVQRESKSSDFKGVSGVILERVQEAHQNKSAPIIMLFPEGTTTNGDYLLPFKSGAFLPKAPVLPVILKYPHQRFSPAWDSISGVRHVILLLCQFVNHLEVIRLPVYCPSQQEKDDPKLYANNVRKLMAHEGNLKMVDIGLAEKREYHAALNGSYSQS
ncbi:lysophospholipid acyltransferase LPEAT1 isoform X2 [Daucus carota subsp. sativus]|uniref:lysophospholipid acyltransferase LPEAT1 isoform X2 n=1 Tax=Daucus carota subsp. sativus TaxID=79200 RepID=UPI0007EF45A8|nr:PREDICTED: lysophospholipid acyltransferase LPEAT1-like isoform X2 [Daucus carota subsp. sativus]